MLHQFSLVARSERDPIRARAANPGLARHQAEATAVRAPTVAVEIAKVG